MALKSMRSQAGRNTIRISPAPASVSGSNATSGENSVPNSDQKADKRISVGWHWTYGFLRRPESDEVFGYAYEGPDGDMIYIPNPEASKRVMLECRVCSTTGERYVCLYRDK